MPMTDILAENVMVYICRLHCMELLIQNKYWSVIHLRYVQIMVIIN